jgi:type IV fimbrial biogenesis protein FimT
MNRRKNAGRGSLHHQGFTLIELMVTLSIAAILMAIAAPSFVEMTRRNRIVTYTNTFMGSLSYARSEAIRRGSPISVCHSNDGLSCSGSWNDGWIIFVNPNGGSPAAVDTGETVVAAHEGLSSGYTLASDTFTSDLTFAADGSASNTGTFAVCHDASTTGARAIIVTTLRPRVGTDTDGDGIPNTDSGNIADCDP